MTQIRRNTGSKNKQSFSDKKKSPKNLECYYCGKLVKYNAVKCKYCGKWYSSGKKTVAFTLFIVMTIVLLAIPLSSILFSDGQESFRPPNGMPDINLDDWDVDSAVTMPEDDPDITGMITDKFDTYFVSLQTRDRESQTTSTEYVYMDENTNIFLVDMESQSVSVVSIEDVQEGSLMRVWGTQNPDGSWHATDVSLMTGRPDGGRP